MSTTRHHADWLSLVEVSGPFVSLPVLMRAFPQGLEPRDPTQAKMLRAAYEEWQDNPSAPGRQRAWVMHVLTAVLDWPENQIAEGQTLPAGLEAGMSEMGETLRPDFALVGPTGTATAGQPQLLIASYPAEQRLDKPVIGKHWKATPATRMMELLHAANVPLGLVTNGEHWMLVYAPRGEATGYASWYGALWLDEPITLRAFHSLLRVRRFVGVAADSTLLALLKESASDQQEVTDQLGYQVREAVEMLVQSFDALDQESQRACLNDIAPAMVYDAALTVMMRLVFLFSAEERGLLHLGKPLYDNNYAVSTLQEQLQEVADRYGEEVLERRYDAWTRLLATFRAVHGGIQHQDLLMQAYGGSLFDPDRYPFLEGRTTGSQWRSTPAEPLAVNNRIVLHLLNSLQRLRTKAGGGVAETRRVSFRALGVEQIGHVYEGLLDHTGVRATEVVLGIRGTLKQEPEIALSKLEALLAQGEDKLLDHLREETGRSLPALRKEFNTAGILDEHKLLLACNHDAALLARLRPFAGLIREDSFARPWVVLPGSTFVTEGTTRRSTGTHYTPPSLTEPIVQHTLEPLIFVGPAEGLPRDQWKLKSPKAILDLKVCDMAMGSGAFLVQACRYLAERLVEAWENEEKAHPGQVLITPEGQFSEGSPSDRLVPAEAAERIAIARRTVADRCLYGVDINPMAVEMAKLSMWLITVDANRPFTFLDHAFKCGDSLLGVTLLEQLENFSQRPGGGKQQAFATLNLWRHIDEAKKKREALEAMPSDTPEQVAAKAALHAEAEEAVAKLQAAADVLLAVELKGLKGKAYQAERELAADHMMACWARGLAALQDYACQRMGERQVFHWALAFPEIIENGGFHAFVGNPPFVGGQKITGALGTDYRDYLVAHLAQGRKGSADLCTYFFLRAASLLRPGGMAGLLATNTIAQGDTREVGLDALVAAGVVIPRAVPSAPWPGVAALEVAHVWLHRGAWQGGCMLNDQAVAGITPLLTEPGRVSGKPYRLEANTDKSFIGSYVLGMGFVLTPEEAAGLIERNPSNRDCLFPYLNGEDLNSRPDQSPSRRVINFFDWPLNRSGVGCWAKADEKQRKAWLRAGIVPVDYPNPVATDYPDLLAIVEEKVKPEREKNNRATRRERWWQYAEIAPALYATIAGMDRYLVHPLTSKHHNLVFYGSGQVSSHMTVVLAVDTWSEYAVLQSEVHWKWALEYGNKLETRPQYTPSDCFETFPFPEPLTGLDAIGERYYQRRQIIMQSHLEGLTRTYNRFHDPQESAVEIAQLRRLHVEMDHAVAAAYGWQDLGLDHGFHETKQGVRFTISEVARREVLDRLLALNHQRHAEEVAAVAAEAAAAPAKRGRKKEDAGNQALLDF
ncbi:hypothetical protein N234_18830 [Ralstonia pickettii DTP0602]|nr:hypothetical protein N234_18830 [Ralstonia pickettii DTP0602]